MDLDLYKRNISPHIETLLDMADQKSFDTILNLISNCGIGQEHLGEALFKLADQAVGKSRCPSGIAILEYLLQSLEDPSESHLIYKKMGELYLQMGNNDIARHWYEKLPPNFQSIKAFYLKLCRPAITIEDLFSARDQIFSQTPESQHHEIIHITNTIVKKILQNPAIAEQHHAQYESNRQVLKQLWPFSGDPGKDASKPKIRQSRKLEDMDIFRADKFIYFKSKDQWLRSPFTLPVPKVAQTALKSLQGMICFCDCFNSILTFLSHSTIENPVFYKKECWVVLPFDLLFQVMHIADFTPLLHCHHIIRFIEKQHLKLSLHHLLLTRNLLPPKGSVCFKEDEASYLNKEILPMLRNYQTQAEQRMDKYIILSRDIFEENYQQKVLEKIRANQPLKVFFMVSRFSTYIQYSIRDIASGFRQLGHEVLVETEDKDAGLSVRQDVTLKNMIDFQPDLVFVINHFRYEFQWFPKHVPFLSWVQDLMPHMLQAKSDDLFTGKDHIFSFSYQWKNNFFKTHKSFKNKKVYLLPVSVSKKNYYPLPNIEKKFDVTFVTNLPDIEETYWPTIHRASEKSFVKNQKLLFLKHLYTEVDNRSWVDLTVLVRKKSLQDDLASTICKKLDIALSTECIQLVQTFHPDTGRTHFGTYLFLLIKSKPVQKLMEHGIKIKVFGNNWNKLPIFQKIAMGPAENGEELNKIINQSRINLNLSPGTSYHMKAPEVIATSSFMLTRNIPEKIDEMPITKLFKLGKEIILVDDEEDLLLKVKYYLANSDKREQIAREAYQKFIDHYEISSAASGILSNISENSASAESE